ncbi:MAG: low molecular weight phosphotyrosine protein phosphatase [Rhodocyclaceae bacterium]|nr:low molecular weight phosphotyrosine protein phosphatase [Rhodocyclaceae bacterium]
MTRVLFVCMGNICRSPTAEAVFRRLVSQRGMLSELEIDSAGTHGYHVGESPDSRTQRAAAERKYDLSQLVARKVAPEDLEYFDIVLAMDRSNLDSLRKLCPANRLSRLKLFMSYARQFDDDEVPDPYYGLAHDFDLVLDMIEDAAEGLLDSIIQERNATQAGKEGKSTTRKTADRAN